MAIRRSTQKKQVIQQLMQVAPPGEQFVACVHCETGPSPWLGIIFDEVPLLGIVITFLRRFYFITMTNTSVVMNTAGRFSNRPGAIIYSFPRQAFPVVKLKRARLWSSMYVQLPGTARPTRLNISRYWRTEFDQLITGLPAPAPIPAQPVAPAQPAPAQPAASTPADPQA
ncbi:MAG TPA: hypothetical protein VFR11_17145 [Micromonosporaceae bacterium]|jgi:hypothetical protein|nr:hypothetical protein [Micromonosporaceae bacterium]